MAKIAYCTPGLGPCGGVRVILEHCTRLQKRGHDVTIINPSGNSPMIWEWYGQMDVPVKRGLTDGKTFDLVVATGGSTVYWAQKIPAERYAYFVQMMEHRFFKVGTSNYYQHEQSYALAHKMGFQTITIAEWLRESLEEYGVDAPVIPNGVNQDQFHKVGDNENYILVEGDNRNPAKDVQGISWGVAQNLKRKYDVALYGYAAIQHPYANLMDYFVMKPSQEEMRRLYSGALFLLKASRFEGRACAPVEAMCCGTTTVRGIIQGDDDLIHEKNCLRTGYDYDAVEEQAERLLENHNLRDRLERGCKKHAKTVLQWDKVIDWLEELYGID